MFFKPTKRDISMKKLYVLTLLAAIFALPTLASANTEKSDAKSDAKAEHYFSKIDTNNDGVISEEEHQKASDDMFNKADANKDGKVTKAEFEAAKKAEKAEWKSEKSSENKALPKSQQPSSDNSKM